MDRMIGEQDCGLARQYIIRTCVRLDLHARWRGPTLAPGWMYEDHSGQLG